jgi:hypothetical protein
MQRTDCGFCRLSMLTCDGRQEETLAKAKNWLASPADYAIPFVGHLRTLRTSTNDEKAGGGCLWLGSTLAVATYPIGWSLGESSVRKLSRNASAVSDAPHSWWAGRFAKSRGARPIQLFEGSRLWVGWTLWNLNRFWSQKPCQTRSFAKTLLSMLIDILLLCAMCVILPPAPSVVQEELRRVRIHAKASAAKRLRSNGLVGTQSREASTLLAAFASQKVAAGRPGPAT